MRYHHHNRRHNIEENSVCSLAVMTRVTFHTDRLTSKFCAVFYHVVAFLQRQQNIRSDACKGITVSTKQFLTRQRTLKKTLQRFYCLDTFSRPCPTTPILLRLKNSSRGPFFFVSIGLNLECCCLEKGMQLLRQTSRGSSSQSTRRNPSY